MVLFRSALLSILSVLVLIPKGFAPSCTENKCLYVEQISLMDCFRAGLQSTPQTKKRIANYMTLFKGQFFIGSQFYFVYGTIFNLKTVDIRNNPIYCKGLNTGGP